MIERVNKDYRWYIETDDGKTIELLKSKSPVGQDLKPETFRVKRRRKTVSLWPCSRLTVLFLEEVQKERGLAFRAYLLDHGKLTPSPETAFL
jgi:hypothetical protein